MKKLVHYSLLAAIIAVIFISLSGVLIKREAKINAKKLVEKIQKQTLTTTLIGVWHWDLRERPEWKYGTTFEKFNFVKEIKFNSDGTGVVLHSQANFKWKIENNSLIITTKDEHTFSVKYKLYVKHFESPDGLRIIPVDYLEITNMRGDKIVYHKE